MSEPKRISFNGGATYWEYSTPKRLAQIKANLAREVERKSFSPARCIEATLRLERRMYEP